MRYEIRWGNSYEYLIAVKLSNEIRRFDVRADVVIINLVVKKSTSADVLIIIARKKHLSSFKQRMIPVFFLLQSIYDYPTKTFQVPNGINLFLDLPGNQSKSIYLGSHLFDILKGVEAGSIDQTYNTDIPIIAGFDNRRKVNFKKLKTSLKSKLNSVRIEVVNIESNVLLGIQRIKNANAAIVTSSVGELTALFFNIPYVRVFKRSLINTKGYSLCNTIAKQDVVKIIPAKWNNEITSELKKILNDHQYCASILDHFQNVKDTIGNQPSLRNIAREIVDKVES